VLSGAFALLALVLASIGLYGMLAYAVAQRTSEIGVRMALGARPRDIILLVCGRGIVLTLLGLGAGLALAAVAARTMQALFYGVPPGYLTAATGASLALLAVAAVACVVPARRATRIAPVVALQQE
jgi:ABC-type antimicrobial peptide transport system permease subunit